MPSLPLARRRPSLLLELDLTQPLVETEPDDVVAKLRSRGKPRLRPMLRALHEAADDDRVVGLVAKVGNPAMPLAQAQELRAAVAAFAASGKPTVAWAETFGEFGNGTVPYLLATGFSEIWLQPSGDVGLVGVAAEVTFLRGALDKLGVEPDLSKRHEFKNAADRVTQTQLTDAHREAVERLTESAWEQVVAAVADGRGLDLQEVRELADRAPVAAHDAHAARLVDRLGYRDEVYATVRRQVGEDATLLFADRWTPPAGPVARVVRRVGERKADAVALVEGHGGIVTGRSRRTPLQGPVMGSDTVAAAFRAAVRDEHVRAIVFRVDSPGGSYVASDTVWREVVAARAAGKPVVVSMGTLAGSGGYFVACHADEIVAEPATLTGSIGVFGGKAVTSGLTDKLGLSYGAVQRGAHARMFSNRQPFTDSERQRLEEWLDAVYDDFVGKVAAGRGMTREAVHEVARGRVWSGADAAERGLVDRLGGLRDAVRHARARAGLPTDAPVRPAVSIPPLARLKPPRSTDDPRAAAVTGAVTGIADAWDGFGAIASRLGLPATGVLTMPGVALR